MRGQGLPWMSTRGMILHKALPQGNPTHCHYLEHCHARTCVESLDDGGVRLEDRLPQVAKVLGLGVILRNNDMKLP